MLDADTVDHRRHRRSSSSSSTSAAPSASATPSTISSASSLSGGNVSAAEAAATCAFLAEMDAFLALEPPAAPELGAASPASSSSLSEYLADGGERAAGTAAPAKKKKKSSTQRQKEELAYLRSKVGQLERELHDLKSSSRGRPERTGDGEEEEGGEEEDALTVVRRPQTMWEAMAQRQLKEKQRAERENAKLKEAIDGQIRLAKVLERMLRKRQVYEDEQAPTYSSRSKQEVAIFKRLRESLNARLHDADAVFEADGPLGFATDALDEVSVVDGDSDGMYIEFSNVRIVPFDFHATAHMTWKHVSAKDRTLKTITANSLIIEETEDTLITKRLSTVLTADEWRTATSRTEFRRFEREDHVLLVWESMTENAGESSSDKPAIRVFQQGSCKIAEAAAKDGSVATRMLSYARMYPRVLSTPVSVEHISSGDDEATPAVEPPTDQLERHHRAGMLTEVMIEFFKQNMQSVRQAIENDLMDDFFRHQRAQRRGGAET